VNGKKPCEKKKDSYSFFIIKVVLIVWKCQRKRVRGDGGGEGGRKKSGRHDGPSDRKKGVSNRREGRGFQTPPPPNARRGNRKKGSGKKKGWKAHMNFQRGRYRQPT